MKMKRNCNKIIDDYCQIVIECMSIYEYDSYNHGDMVHKFLPSYRKWLDYECENVTSKYAPLLKIFFT